MRAKLIVEGNEFDIDIFDPELQKLVAPKKTGYERVGQGDYYFYTCSGGSISTVVDGRNISADDDYECADYYSDSTVAENNARADKLMRQLRRFAVEHRENKIDWSKQTKKYVIRFSYAENDFSCPYEVRGRDVGSIAFDSEEMAKLAIETFHDELIWYFTEYKDSL